MASVFSSSPRHLLSNLSAWIWLGPNFFGSCTYNPQFKSWYPERDSNPQTPNGATDFKSATFTDFVIRAR
jgi:hypothetical protein